MKIPTLRRAPRTLALASAFAVIVACAGTPPPTAQMAVAEASVKHANTSNTGADAAGELQIAIAKLAGARTAMNDKNYQRAGQLAEEAELDAQVAELHAQSARARKAAQESQDAAHVLHEEINRKSDL